MPTTPSRSSESLVELDRVDAGYGGEPALRGVTLAIDPTTFSGVVGPSGSGKTTLLRVLLGRLEVDAGTVRRAPGVSVGYVPQLETVDWNFPVTVEESVLMGLRQRRLVPWPTRSERAAVGAVLDRLGIGHLTGRHIRDLSGGQQQRMFVARALVARPRLLLLDEPTSGLDTATRHEILHLLAELNQEGLAIVLTTHDLNGMAAHLPHLVCLQERVIAEGTPVEVIRADVLERTFGARVDVLEHCGAVVVVDRPASIPDGRRTVLR